MTDRVIKAYKEWFHQEPLRVIFTGSIRQCLFTDSESRIAQKVSINDISKTTSFFIERLSRDFLGRRQVRSGKSVGYFGVIEGGETPLWMGGKRYHIHLGLTGIPDKFDRQFIGQKLNSRWGKLKWALPNTHIEICEAPIDHQRWVHYIMKSVSGNSTERIITNQIFQK